MDISINLATLKSAAGLKEIKNLSYRLYIAEILGETILNSLAKHIC
jgi:hypothetical protein